MLWVAFAVLYHSFPQYQQLFPNLHLALNGTGPWERRVMLMSEEGLAVLLTLLLGYKERHNTGNLCIFLKSQGNHHMSTWGIAIKPRQI